MEGHGSKFGRKKERAIEALLRERTIEDAARAIDISPRTLKRWLSHPEFAREYRQARLQVFGHSMARLQKATAHAVSIILKMMVDSNTSEVSRLRAAAMVLAHAGTALEYEDIELRVANLERLLPAATLRTKT